MKIDIHKTVIIIGLLLWPVIIVAQEKSEANHDFQLELEAEYRYFYDDNQFPDQKNNFPSLAIAPEYNLAWNNGYDNLNVKVFYRLDIDNQRTHGDIRELFYQTVKNRWELNVGLKKIFWGVTESNHLVDIINQTDAVESFDGEKKLGQPMVQFSFNTTSYGTFDVFYLPYHRKRTFPGEKSRLRFPVVIDKDDIGYESSAEEWHQDFALRWKHYFGIFDIGVSHFYGTGREPIFSFDNTGAINAIYPIINQTGIDFQATHNNMLWKLEAIYRTSKPQDFFALAAGLEYTFGNIKNSGIDIGVLGEYSYDERGYLALSSLQNDIFFGSRLAFNDVQSTQILIGGLFDLEQSSKVFSIEASRRLGETFKLELEGRFFSSIDDSDLIVTNFQNDSFFRLSIFKYL